MVNVKIMKPILLYTPLFSNTGQARLRAVKKDGANKVSIIGLLGLGKITFLCFSISKSCQNQATFGPIDNGQLFSYQF